MALAFGAADRNVALGAGDSCDRVVDAAARAFGRRFFGSNDRARRVVVIFDVLDARGVDVGAHLNVDVAGADDLFDHLASAIAQRRFERVR
jgi:hypothetical protein